MGWWRTVRTLYLLWSCAWAGVTWRDKWLAFLLAGLVSMGEHRLRARKWFFKQINTQAHDGQVYLRLWIGQRTCIVAMRQNDREDFLIGGELVKGAYAPPPFTPRQIVDGGANIGLFAIYAGALFPDAKLVCYEPDEKNLAQLRHNLAINGITADVQPVGLWSKETTLYYHPTTSYGGYIDDSPPGIPVPCVVPKIEDDCWLKHDIEGSEYEVLSHLLDARAYPWWISMEIHHFAERGQELVRLLEAHGYHVRGDVSPETWLTTIAAWQETSDTRKTS
ncbi:MAG: FkbM family methyltransferase [Acidobacteriota bacterium]